MREELFIYENMNNNNTSFSYFKSIINIFPPIDSSKNYLFENIWMISYEGKEKEVRIFESLI